MRDIFQNQLAELAEQLLTMSERVTHSLTEAAEALLAPDLPRAEAVIEADAIVDAMQQQLDELAVTVLAKQAPVATDLRVVVSALRISTSLERMGDLAGHLAKLVRIRFPEAVVPPELVDHVREMLELAQRLSMKSTKVIESRDLSLIPELERDDDRLDDLHREMFSQIDALQGKISNAQAADLTLLSRYVERFGDHAFSITKRVAFLVTGEAKRPLAEFHEAPREI